MTEQLLLCPFCGEKPVQVSHLKAYEQSTFGRFRCETFDCPISGLTINERMWNGRTPAGANDLVLTICRMSFAEQYRLAFLVAENIGYDLKSRDPLADLSKQCVCGSIFPNDVHHSDCPLATTPMPSKGAM